MFTGSDYKHQKFDRKRDVSVEKYREILRKEKSGITVPDSFGKI
jgi:hypothetical protein